MDCNSYKKLLDSGNYYCTNKSLVKSIGLLEAVIFQEIISKFSCFLESDTLSEYGVYYSESQIANDFGISISTASRVIGKLIELKLMSKQKKGLPSKMYYDITDDNWAVLMSLISPVKMTELVPSNLPNLSSQNDRTYTIEEEREKQFKNNDLSISKKEKQNQSEINLQINLQALANYKLELLDNFSENNFISNKKNQSMVWDDTKAKASIINIFSKIEDWISENPKRLTSKPNPKNRFNKFAENNDIGWIYPSFQNKTFYSNFNTSYQTEPNTPLGIEENTKLENFNNIYN